MTGGLGVVIAVALLAAESAGNDLERLKQLVGRWRGTYESSGRGAGAGAVEATYSLSASGAAIVEDLVIDGQRAMTSVYHVDRQELRVAHFRREGHQPLSRAASQAGDEIRFALFDSTNLQIAPAEHVEAIELHFGKGDTLGLTFAFRDGVSRTTEHLRLARVPSGRSAPVPGWMKDARAVCIPR